MRKLLLIPVVLLALCVAGCDTTKTPEAEVERACHALYWTQITAIPGRPGWFDGTCPGGKHVTVYGPEW